MPKQLVDLSHTVSHGLITYKGLPAPIICDFLSREQSREHYAPGTEFHIAKIEMVANTGTYLDSPFHRYEDGKDLSQLELSSLANLDGIVVRAKGEGQRAEREVERAIDAKAFEGLEIKGKAILIHTGWSQHWRTDKYFEGTHPFLTKDAAQFIADEGAALVGIDSYNIDDTADLTRPAHSILLGKEIPIVEHMSNLQTLIDALADYPLAVASGSVPFKFFAVAVKVKGMGTFPVRAFAIIG
ncbi:MAG TPA: cyclase family protein [Pyrinomonadaceae bacterium]|nr:cyclase family protein [Pyrinomonadaceae bacterium]